jgi:hypothetical protein
MKTIEQLEYQVMMWSKLSIIAPLFFTGFLGILFLVNIIAIELLFYIACGLYFFTAVIWWWWTMHSIVFLSRLLKNANLKLDKVTAEIIDLRKEII